MKMQRIFMIALLLLLVGVIAVAGCVSSEKVAKDGDTVSVHYTLTVDDTELESNFDSTPLSFKLGSGSMITGFNNGIIGMKAGETKTITVSPKEGYGTYSKENTMAFKPSEVKTAPGETISVGDILSMGNGQYTGEVLSIDYEKDTMLLAVNHRLADKTLTFKIKLLEIK